MLGGACAALLVPLLFARLREYPRAPAAACVLRPHLTAGPSRRSLDLLMPLAVLVLILLQARWRRCGLPDLRQAAVLLLALPPRCCSTACRPGTCASASA